jgi:CRP-like cAMP-binding protein
MKQGATNAVPALHGRTTIETSLGDSADNCYDFLALSVFGGNSMNKTEVLKRSDLFRTLDEDELALVAAIGSQLEFDKGSTVCKQGTLLDNIYVIEEGVVAIILEVGPMAERQVQAATHFESFGWVAMIPPFTCTATARTLEKTKVIAFSRDELYGLCTARPDMGFKVLQSLACVMSGRLRQAYLQLLGVTGADGH